MTIVPRPGRIPISLTIVTTFVALVVVLLGSVLAISYFSSLRSTLSELVVSCRGDSRPDCPILESFAEDVH